MLNDARTFEDWFRQLVSVVNGTAAERGNSTTGKEFRPSRPPCEFQPDEEFLADLGFSVCGSMVTAHRERRSSYRQPTLRNRMEAAGRG